jgi:quercetin dioxygenase-like cupin family protein
VVGGQVAALAPAMGIAGEGSGVLGRRGEQAGGGGGGHRGRRRRIGREGVVQAGEPRAARCCRAMTTIDIPKAILRNEAELPFVDLGDGVDLQLLQVDVEAGLWVIRSRFAAGTTIPTHKHTGTVYAFTLSGSWKYLEYPDDVNVAGSYLYEPAGSVHTLHVPETNTEVTDVVFVITGANLNLDEEGNVVFVIDAALVRDAYLGACEANGLGRPDVIGA